MATIDEQIKSANSVIVRNIEMLSEQRDLLSQNVLAQLRNLIEGLIVLAHLKDGAQAFRQSLVGAALDHVRAHAHLNLLSRFHHRLQAGSSHYTLDGDPSERLMLTYYAYLVRTRDLARARLDVHILENLAKFPTSLDESLSDYYEKIADRIGRLRPSGSPASTSGVYYIHASRPFFVHGNIYYEVTYSLAHNRASKSDRNIAFTDVDMTDKYAARLELTGSHIDVIRQTMPITLIRSWEVAIRGCEFDNFARIVGTYSDRVRPNLVEYKYLMQYLTTRRGSLLDLMDMSDALYGAVRDRAMRDAQRSSLVFKTLDEARQVIRSGRPGSTLLRFLMLRMRNQVIKDQYASGACFPLAGLHVSHSCRPFDTMPFCTHPKQHKASFGDLAEALDSSRRRHEVLARRVNDNVQLNGQLYTPEEDLDGFGDLDALIATHNRLLPPNNVRHARRRLVRDHGHVFAQGYEDDTVAIIGALQGYAAGGIPGHASDMQAWLDANPEEVDDDEKAAAMKGLFAYSKVAVVYGAAGTGKSTMVNHIANYFGAHRKLFIAHTNPAVDNLRNRVGAPHSDFFTINKQLSGWGGGGHYDLLVIDECSTVSNEQLLQVLQNTSFDQLVLVGDAYQIEAIEFGNWFRSIRSYLPATSVFELKHPWRTKDPELLTLWDRVRKLDARIEESLSDKKYSAVLDEELFTARHEDEIVLCTNYDGLYGVNNVNRFLQVSNPGKVVVRRGTTYKVGDPVLFNETNRFRGVIFNNLKGVIVDIDEAPGRVTFDVEIARDVDEYDVRGTDLIWVKGNTVRFDVFEMGDQDDDDDSNVTIVPFQIAYAVSFHKAQGLEFQSVKVVITDVNEGRVTHSMFYTAITRARKHLTVFWTPQTQKRILERLAIADPTTNDESLLRVRRGIMPVTKRPKMAKSRDLP